MGDSIETLLGAHRRGEAFTTTTASKPLLFDGTLPPNGETMTPDPSRPGHGLALREPDAAPLLVA
jgi:hypothetical protein